MIVLREYRGTEVIDFCDFESWESIEDVIKILKQYFEVNIFDHIDGPESRVWHLTLNGKIFSLHNNPYGNYLKPNGLASEFFMTDNMPLFYKAFN